MGYEICITRNRDWWDEEKAEGISLEEWKACVDSDPSLRFEVISETTMPDGTVFQFPSTAFGIWLNDNGNEVCFGLRNGRISLNRPRKPERVQMYQIAQQLGAKVVGEEGEEYGEDGDAIEDEPEEQVLNVARQAETVSTIPLLSPFKPKRPWWKFW